MDDGWAMGANLDGWTMGDGRWTGGLGRLGGWTVGRMDGVALDGSWSAEDKAVR